MSGTISQRCVAEFVGTALLVATVVGSGVMASRLSDDHGLQLLENSVATGAVLVALIFAFGSTSAAFNPVVTFTGAVLGTVDLRDVGALVLSQFVGGFVGVLAANVMFGVSATTLSGTARAGSGQWLGEVIATLGLLVIVFRTGADNVAFAVGGYIAAAYWFTSSTSFANPAVTFARMFSDSFAGIAPGSVPGFVAMQLLGAAVAIPLIKFLQPKIVLA